jgi:putative DNA primase/helicase
MCDGSDRFRFDDKEGRGTWFCNQCGHGDGFDLVQQFTGRDFRDVAAEIDKMRPNAPAPSAEPFKPKVDVETRRRHLNGIWATATAQELVPEYLHNRMITRLENLTDIRGHPDLRFRDQKLGTATFPAIVTLIRGPDGSPVSVHRTYLLPDGTRLKKIMPPTEPIRGGAIRLSTIVNKTLVVAEGIESALAGRELYTQLPGAPKTTGVWAAISANGMRTLDIPVDITTLVICADADKTFTGQSAAYDLAHRVVVHQLRHAITQLVVAMPVLNNDMADALRLGHTQVQWTGTAIERKKE